MLTKDSAICIKATDYSETSQIVTMFTEKNGKISAIVKGSKRPKSSFGGPIEILSYGKIIFTPATESRKLATLTEFDQQPAIVSSPKDLFALNCSFFAAELINLLSIDYDPHPELFEHAIRFLQNTRDSQNDHDTMVLLIFFQLTLLKEIGLQPILKGCVNCKNDIAAELSQTYFSSSANGLVCRDCEPAFTEKIKLTADAAKCLTNLKHIADADDRVLKEIEKVLVYHFTEIIHKPPRMAKHILKQ